MDNNTKKIVKEEWQRAFPSLSAYAQNKFYKIIGSFLCGIELINIPRSENYRPHFVIYPLYKENIKSCLDYPILMFEFYNSKTLQLNLSYHKVDEKLKDTLSIVLNNIQILLNGNVKLETFCRFIDNVQSNETSSNSHSGNTASLFELKFYAALYVGNPNQLQNVLNQIEQSSKNWNMQLFETWYGKFDIWFKELQQKVSNREGFLKQIEVNKQDKKVKKIQSSELFT